MASKKGPSYEALEKIKRYIDLGDTPEGIVAQYDKHAGEYNADVTAIGYEAPSRTADLLLQYMPNDTTQTKIMDIACGTGLCGEALRSKGFVGALFGIDGSEKMASFAQKTGCYDEIRIQILCPEMAIESPAICDGLISVGSFTKNHLSAKLIGRMADLLATGGVMAFSCRDSIDNAAWLEEVKAEISSLVKSDSVTEVLRTKMFHGVNWNADGDEKGNSALFIFVLRKI